MEVFVLLCQQVGRLTVTALSTPCHTSGHICYYVESEDRTSRAVFTGMATMSSGGGGLIVIILRQVIHYLSAAVEGSLRVHQSKCFVLCVKYCLTYQRIRYVWLT